MVAVSDADSTDLPITSTFTDNPRSMPALQFSTVSRMLLLSVATYTLSMYLQEQAALIVQYTSGFPLIGFIFFKGIDLLPPLTGINATFI